ncbi:hypothetical protein BHE74_00054729 [Ensete ventricosum]|uniref:Uncharacterized protein n=1 Tax=Ensete ventricosum TaxID=4639 RepID=A0A444DGW8_ENSVE|nr:hypothetical protein GW17_00039847 [Ensete ventricosum]RWW39895.1 hypothetical protein BHE74_00054729 [Ensete ventricosum]RZR75483.1 hypothetical protein BHM03_00058985 [Ensete ventricosum]
MCSTCAGASPVGAPPADGADRRREQPRIHALRMEAVAAGRQQPAPVASPETLQADGAVEGAVPPRPELVARQPLKPVRRQAVAGAAAPVPGRGRRGPPPERLAHGAHVQHHQHADAGQQHRGGYGRGRRRDLGRNRQ